MNDYGSELDLPAISTESWGNVDMGGDEYFVDLYGIQWSQDENTIMFPDRDDNEEPDSFEVNTLVSMEEEEDVLDHEEDDNPDSDLNYENICSIGFPTMSSYASSASPSCLELRPNFCGCTESIGSIDCIDYNSLVVCSVCCCLNYAEIFHCMNCLELIKCKSTSNI